MRTRKGNFNKGKEICEMYKNGVSLTTISKYYGNTLRNIIQYLNKYYIEIYGMPWKKKNKRIVYRDKELYEKFQQVYTPFVYTRKSLSESLGCSTVELEHMCNTYNITHLRLKTYQGQKTLCNVPDDVYIDVVNYARKHKMSIRDVAMRALNEYMIRDLVEEK